MNKKQKSIYDKARYAELVQRKPCAVEAWDSLTVSEAGYIAGLFDGEGSFGIAKVKASSGFIPTFSISMTHKPTMKWLSGKLGSPLKRVKRNGSLPHWKTQFCLRLHGKRLVRLSIKLLPFLITKKEQARLVIVFAATYIKQGGAGHRIPIRTMRKRKSLKERMHALNGNPHLHEVPELHE